MSHYINKIMNYLKMKRPKYEDKPNDYKNNSHNNYYNGNSNYDGNNNWNYKSGNQYYNDNSYYDGGKYNYYNNDNNFYNNQSFKSMNSNKYSKFDVKNNEEKLNNELITISSNEIVCLNKEKILGMIKLDSDKQSINSNNEDLGKSYLVDDAPYINPENMEEFVQFLNSNLTNFKISKSMIIENYYSMDISLVCKGRDEEELYLERPIYMKNICRGNTFLVKYENKKENLNKISSFTLVRKGMRKFVDISLDFITIKDEKYLKNDHLDKSKLSSKKVLFGPILRAFNDNKLIKVTKMVKANGENAQISYCENLDSWVICSKNIAIFVKTYKDLEYYMPKTNYDNNNNPYEVNIKFSFAYLIGIAWFDILKKVKDEKALKEFLKKHTLIGEYIGNQYHQHLIRYIEHTIHFYSIVEKIGEKICLNVDNAIEIFQKHNLTVVPFEVIGVYSDYKSLCESLENLHHRIAESSIIDEEEGSVLYFTAFKASEINLTIEIDKNDNSANTVRISDEEVVSLGKLKTYEYKLYRKLREKLSNHLKRDKEDRFKINQFFDEIRTILTGYILPMPMEFYYKVAEVAFNFIEILPKDMFINRGEIELRGNYIDFLEIVLKMVDKTVDLRTQAISEAGIVNTEYLMNKSHNTPKIQNQTTEIYIYVPPFIEDLEKLIFTLEKNFKIKIKKTAFSLDTNYKDNIRVSIIHWHNFKKILKLKRNQFIIFLNSEKFPHYKDQICDKIKSKNISAQELVYNKDETLSYFIKNNDKSVEEKLENYFNLSINFIDSIKKYIHHDNYMSINEIDANLITNWIKSKYELIHEKIDLKSYEDLSQNSENINLTNLDDTIYNEQIFAQNNLVLSEVNNDKTKDPLVLFYCKYTNPFQKFEKEFENRVKLLVEKEKENNINPNENQINQIINKKNDLNKLFNEKSVAQPGEEIVEDINSVEIKNNIENKNTPNVENIKDVKNSLWESKYIKYKDKFEKGFKYFVILVPMTLPGSGKTSFIDPLKEICKLIGVSFFTVGSDSIRKNLMNEYKRKNRNSSDDDAFKQTGKRANFVLEDELKYIVDDFYNGSNLNGILFVDKNHPPNAISRTME